MRLEMGTTDVLPVWLNEPDMPRLKLEAMVIARMHALRSMLGQGSAIYCDLPSAPKAAPAKRKATRKATMMTGEQFFDARMAACRAIAAECGENWHLVEGASHWASIPSKLRSFTTARGTKIKCHADARLPAARFWADGMMPEGVIVSPDMPRDRTPIAEVHRLAMLKQAEAEKWPEADDSSNLPEADDSADWSEADDSPEPMIRAA